MYRLIGDALQELVLSGKYANCTGTYWELLDAESDLMNTFMKKNPYSMNRGSFVKAKKICKRYVYLLISNKLI